jgi:predicted component of type VI protein secretion system
MKVSLVVAKGKRAGKVLPISDPQFVIGRHKECQLRASGSTISQHHCALLIRGGQVFVRDFDSTNGTFVNQQRVQGERELVPNDLLQLGQLAFHIRIEYDGEESSLPAAEKADESFIGDMLLKAGDNEEGILGLLEDSKCGSTIMRTPLGDDEPASGKVKEDRSEEPKEQIESTEDEESASPPPGPSQNDEIAKKLLEELHRSVRAKHNRPS